MFALSAHIRPGSINRRFDITPTNSIVMDPFEPKLLPLTSISWEEHIEKLGKANRALSNYDGKLSGIINQDLLFVTTGYPGSPCLITN